MRFHVHIFICTLSWWWLYLHIMWLHLHILYFFFIIIFFIWIFLEGFYTSACVFLLYTHGIQVQLWLFTVNKIFSLGAVTCFFGHQQSFVVNQFDDSRLTSWVPLWRLKSSNFCRSPVPQWRLKSSFVKYLPIATLARVGPLIHLCLPQSKGWGNSRGFRV